MNAVQWILLKLVVDNPEEYRRKHAWKCSPNHASFTISNVPCCRKSWPITSCKRPNYSQHKFIASIQAVPEAFSRPPIVRNWRVSAPQIWGAAILKRCGWCWTWLSDHVRNYWPCMALLWLKMATSGIFMAFLWHFLLEVLVYYWQVLAIISHRIAIVSLFTVSCQHDQEKRWRSRGHGFRHATHTPDEWGSTRPSGVRYQLSVYCSSIVWICSDKLLWTRI